MLANGWIQFLAIVLAIPTIILAVLMLFMPYFVYKIHMNLSELVEILKKDDKK